MKYSREMEVSHADQLKWIDVSHVSSRNSPMESLENWQQRRSTLRETRKLAARDHAFRSATIGSTRAARRAGIADASSATRPSISTATASMIGSHGLTPNN
jgi:hypothetical protein